MPSLIDIRRRIRSVKSTQQITRAMKLVSAAKLRRAQDRVLAARPYAGILARLLADVAQSAKSDERLAHPLLAERPEERIQLILITADRGLAGAFNSNLVKTAQKFLEEHQGRVVELEAIGRKGRDFFRKYGGIGLSCACLALSREAWQATGFSGSAYATDKFVQRALCEKGFRIAGTRGVVAWHGHAYSLRDLVKRCLNEGYGWRLSGAKYKLRWYLRDLTMGFAENAAAWLRCLWSAQARDLASIFFFQIRPICVLIGNRFLKQRVK